MIKIEKQIIKVLIVFILLFYLQFNCVYAQDEQLLSFDINCPSSVNESFFFLISITSDNIAVDNVTVTFNKNTNITNSEGIVGFFAPRVLPDENNTYIINAKKEGYNSSTCQVIVLYYPQIFPIVSISNILENTKFIVTVIDDERRVVNDVKVVFNGKEYISSGTGTVTLTAPSVNKSEIFNISISKPNYIGSSISVTIYPSISSENIIGFYFVIGICIVIVFITGLYMLFKKFKTNRINRK